MSLITINSDSIVSQDDRKWKRIENDKNSSFYNVFSLFEPSVKSQ